MASKIEIYSRATCPFCIRAKQLLDAHDLDYAEVDIGREPERRDEMIERAGGRSTVPQIFIDGTHVGGCDDLFRLESTGELERLLAA